MNGKGRHSNSENSRPGKSVRKVIDAEGVVAIGRQVADEVADASLEQARKRMLSRCRGRSDEAVSNRVLFESARLPTMHGSAMPGGKEEQSWREAMGICRPNPRRPVRFGEALTWRFN